MAEDSSIGVSVVYAEADRLFETVLRLPGDATVGEAIVASGVHKTRPDIEVNADSIGIFARKATFETRLRDGDRVEIYRTLKIDPKESRRRRAEESARK